MAPPTSAQRAERLMQEIEVVRRAKCPEILQKGFVKLLKIIDDPKTAPAVIVRIVELMSKELKELKEEDDFVLEKPEEKEDKPTASLLSLDLVVNK